MAKIIKAVTMSDIAARLNISTVTVSKALSNQKGVSEEMREKIKALAQEMGYKYSAPKDREKSYVLGILVPDHYMNRQDSFYGRMCQEITAKATQRGFFALMEFLEEESIKEGKLPKLIQENKVDGLVVVGNPGFHYHKVLMDKVKKPLVYMDFFDAEIQADAVISNSYVGSYLLSDYLIRAGHKEIAYVGTLGVTGSITDRYLGYVRAMMEHGLKIEPQWLIKDRETESDGLKNTYKEIELPERMPTAFVCNCDYAASLVIHSLREAGYRVPEDVSVVGFDNYIYPWQCDIGITTYEVNIVEMAKKSVEVLYNKLKGLESQSHIYTIEGHLVEKDSVQKIG